MEARQRVAIGTAVMRNKQYLTAVRPLEGALAMSTMHFADEIVSRTDIDELSTRRTKPDAAMLDGRFTEATTAPGRCVSADVVLEVELAADVGVRHIAQPHVVVPGVIAQRLPCDGHVDVGALGVHPLGLLDHDA